MSRIRWIQLESVKHGSNTATAHSSVTVLSVIKSKVDHSGKDTLIVLDQNEFSRKRFLLQRLNPWPRAKQAKSACWLQHQFPRWRPDLIRLINAVHIQVLPSCRQSGFT